MKFKAKTRNCQLIVRGNASFGETIDEKELTRFSRANLRGFLRPEMIKKKTIEYTGPVGISLHERLTRPVEKRDFLFILEQIVAAVQKIHANKFSLGSLMMDMHNIYFNENTKELQFVYAPLTVRHNDMSLVSLIDSVVYSSLPGDKEDNEFVFRFSNFLRSLSVFDINKIEAFVAKEDKSVITTIKKLDVGQSDFMTADRLHYHEHYDKKKAAERDDATDLLLDEDEATGLLSEEATGLLAEDEEETGLLVSDEEETGLLNEEADMNYPTLFRVQTEETIVVNKAAFRLGKDASRVDYAVTNNIAISRSHADIITRSNGYYIKDLESKNHTYINNQQLPVMCETEIFSGDRLKLANEEFVFNV